MPAKKATKKTTAKKTAAKKTAFTPKNLLVASLGFYGKVFDVVMNQVEDAQKTAPKQFDALVKRGEKAQKDLTKAGKSMTKSIRDYDVADAKDDLGELVDTVRDTLTPAKA
ncbi:MAG: hypothetical protein AB8B86_10610 [Pseudomonadales bacterium]